ncbi:AMP-binding protein [candidate division KSB1 bacterium]|nr:AMP-binding protein [candidate division KSB1 bacterium]
MLTLPSLLNKTVEKIPEQSALVFNEHKIEYGLLIESARRLAQGLKDMGFSKGDPIAIMLPNVPHFCTSYYGILELGAIAVPINIMYNMNDIQHHIHDSGAKAIIAWVGYKDQVLSAVAACPECRTIIFLGSKIPAQTYPLTQIIASSKPLSQPVDIQPSDIAVINYTSGVANVPLGAEFTHEALIANATTYRDMFRISQEEKLLAVLPLFHPLGQTLVMNAAFTVGATVVLLPVFSPEAIIETIQKNSVTFLAAVPSMFKKLLELQIEIPETPSLKLCINYGGALPEEILEKFESKFNTLVLQAYGLTEAGPLVTANRINRDRKKDSAGLPLVGVELQIRDTENQQLRPKQNGQIWVKGPGIMKQFHNRPDETKKILQDGWLFTGDIGFLDEDHYLYIRERKEDIILKAGFEIYPGEIEQILLEHPAVSEAAVIGVPDTAQGFEVKAFLVLKPEETATSQEIDEYCKQFLPVYKSPRIIEFCTSLPKSPTGRILKKVLRSRAGYEKNNTQPI